MTINQRTDLLFPPKLIPALRNLRGEVWRDFVDTIVHLPETHPDKLAFCLLMIRLDACLSCLSGSYRFMRGCELCATQTIARYQGTDEELIAQYERAKHDLARYQAGETDLELAVEAPEPDVWE
ncbi:MAG TPA: hypothetical protein PKO09_06250 [Anaerolineae bacterium]|nr:hypothetical protein [Anaerolineae bacterium]